MQIIRHEDVDLSINEIMEIVNGPETEYELIYYKEDIIMKKYVVEYADPETGATSPIDNFTAEDGYTAEQYIKDCDSNADDEWCEMLHRGTVTLVEVE